MHSYGSSILLNAPSSEKFITDDATWLNVETICI